MVTLWNDHGHDVVSDPHASGDAITNLIDDASNVHSRNVWWRIDLLLFGA